jgi:hypothetical protein
MSAALTLPYVWATAAEPAERAACAERPRGEIAFYRRRTEGLLRRYLRASLAVGRVPSIAEDITFRGRASSHTLKNFEDVVIFVIDVERCLKMLEPQALQLVVKIALQEYMLMEVAERLCLDARTVTRIYGAALDQLTLEFLKRDLLLERSQN